MYFYLLWKEEKLLVNFITKNIQVNGENFLQAMSLDRATRNKNIYFLYFTIVEYYYPDLYIP